MEPDDYVPLVCSSLDEVMESLTRYAKSVRDASSPASDSPQEFLRAVVNNLKVLKQVVESDGQEATATAEIAPLLVTDGEQSPNGDGQVPFVAAVSKDAMEALTASIQQRVEGARLAQEAEEKARAERKAERKAQKEKKAAQEQQSTSGGCGSSSGDGPAPTSWCCPTCTFENGIIKRKCEVCGTYRPAEAVPKPKETPAAATGAKAGGTPPKKGAASGKRKGGKYGLKAAAAADLDDALDGEGEEDEDDDDDDDNEEEEEEVVEGGGGSSSTSKGGKGGSAGDRKRRIFPHDRRLKVNRGTDGPGSSGPLSNASTASSSSAGGKRMPRGSGSSGGGLGGAVGTGGAARGSGSRKRTFSTTIVSTGGGTGAGGANMPQSAFGNSPRGDRDRADSMGSDDASSVGGFDIGMGGGRGSLWLHSGRRGGAGGGAGTAVDEEDEEEDQGVLVWVCAVCTLENEMRARTCAACGESRAHAIRGVPSIFLTADSPRIKRVKVSDNPRKDPLLGPEHQIEDAKIPAASMNQQSYTATLGLHGGKAGSNADSVYWETIWEAVDNDNDNNNAGGGGGGGGAVVRELLEVYPEAAARAQAEAEAALLLTAAPGGESTSSSSSTGAAAVGSTTPGATPREGANGTSLTPKTGYKIVNGHRFPDIPVPDRPAPACDLESYLAEEPDNVALSLKELYRNSLSLSRARESRAKQISCVSVNEAPAAGELNGRDGPESRPRSIQTTWSEEPFEARGLDYPYARLGQSGYDTVPTAERDFSGTLIDDFEAAISEHGEQWSAVRKALHGRYTVRQLQDFFYSVWSTATFKEQRRRAERAYASACRAKEAAEAKEKSRLATEKKKADKERKREEREKERAEKEAAAAAMPSIPEKEPAAGNNKGGGVDADAMDTAGEEEGDKKANGGDRDETSTPPVAEPVASVPVKVKVESAPASAPAPAPAPAFVSRFAPKTSRMEFKF